MKKNFFFLLVSLIFFMTDAQAQESCEESSCCVDDTSFYAKILTGVNFLQNNALNGNKTTYQPGYMIGGSLGYNWLYNLRLEAEYAFRRNTIKQMHFFGQGSSKHGYFQTSSYMANLLWNVPLPLLGCSFWDIQPFVGAGVGYDYQHQHSSNDRIIFDQKWNHFAWQVMTGLTYPVFCNAEISLEYKFHQGGSHFYNHLLGIGFVYKFDFLK